MSIGCRLVLLAASLLLNHQIVVQAALVCPQYSDMDAAEYTAAFCKGTDCNPPNNTPPPCADGDACSTGTLTFAAGTFSDVDAASSFMVPMCYKNGQDFQFKVCHNADPVATDNPPVTGGATEAPSDLPAWTGNCALGNGTLPDACSDGAVDVTVTVAASETVSATFTVGSCDSGTSCRFCVGATVPFGPLGFTADCGNNANPSSKSCAGACYGGSLKNDTAQFVWRGCSSDLAAAAFVIESANAWDLLPDDAETYLKDPPMLTCDAATKRGSCDDSGGTDICLRCCETANCNNWVGHGNFMTAESGASTLIQSSLLLLGTFVLTFSTRQ